MAHVELGIEERRQIERLRLARTPVARIAARLRRHRSTIYRELRRNRFVDEELPELDGYWGAVAHEMATGRRRRRRKLVRMPSLLVAVIDRLRAGWSPEQIAGRLRRDGSGAYVSDETSLTPGSTRRTAGSAAWPGIRPKPTPAASAPPRSQATRVCVPARVRDREPPSSRRGAPGLRPLGG